MIFDQVADGTHVILAMLVVGLVILGVIGFGELVHSLGERRRERKRHLYPY